MDAIANRLLSPKIKRTTQVIQEFLGKCKKPYVAWSGGKDSTLALHFAMQSKPDIEAIYFDADSSLPDTEEYIERMVREWDINFRNVKTRSMLDVFKEHGLSPGIEYQTMKATVYEPVKQLVEEGYDGAIIGVRAEESRGRLMGGCNYGQLFFAKGYGYWQAWPVLWWTTKDVWLYIDTKKMPYNSAYDKTRFAEREDIRISYWAGETKRTWGRWAWLKYYYPELFQKLTEVIPEAKGFV